MDFGALVGFDGCSVSPPDPDTNQKLYGSALCNTVINQDDDDCRRKRIDFKKMTKTTDDLSAIHRATSLIRSNGGHVSDSQQMLCFSSPNSLPSSLPYYHSAYARNTASGYGSSMHGIKGPFTPSQWMELEHQALIYKYITASAPVPSNLLIPIRKALESVVFSSFPGSHLRPNSLGWGGFHLGFSNTDPEPGRCRRTDGKKWRCSKDAVIDQKYCERHMNRGRHRSRKPVEGQTGQSSASRPPTTAAASKVVLPSSSTPPSVVTGSNSSNSLSINNLQRIAPPALSRGFMNNGNGLKQDRFSIPKQHDPYEQTSLSEFGLVSSNSLLNPLHKTYQDLNQETKSHHSLRQFMDDWPKNRSDKTELSISIPVPSSDFMSSTSSPRNEKHIPPSPLRLSRENFDPTQMETNPKKQENWVPISWENAMGGPLGEVLHSTNNSSSAGDYKGAALNLMTEGWDSCPSIASSPTGVLQKSTFRSLSNSSAGSSPIITSLAQI